LRPLLAHGGSRIVVHAERRHHNRQRGAAGSTDLLCLRTVAILPRSPAMKPFTATAVVVLTIVAVIHLLRLLAGWQLVVSGFVVPVWWSAPGCIVAAGLAVLPLRAAPPA